MAKKFIKRNQKSNKPSSLENTVALSVASVGIISGILISGTRITGNVVGSMKSTSEIYGIILMGLGLIALLLYKNRNK